MEDECDKGSLFVRKKLFLCRFFFLAIAGGVDGTSLGLGLGFGRVYFSGFSEAIPSSDFCIGIFDSSNGLPWQRYDFGGYFSNFRPVFEAHLGPIFGKNRTFFCSKRRKIWKIK